MRAIVMGMTSGIIFDLDGTLLDTIEDIASACNRVLAEFGFAPRTLPEYRRFVGSGIEVLARRALPAGFANEGLFPHVLSAVRREYAAGVVDKTRAYPGIPELLETLSERGVPMAVFSNKPHDLTLESVRRLLGRWHFAAVIGARPGRAHKPDPAAALEIAALLGKAPADVFLVGDTEVDIATAANAGMKAVACAWGFRSREELAGCHPFALIDAPGDLLDLFS
jgi:phosphoglycolate phosphatase